VIQKNGDTLPGIKEWGCNEGTSAMPAALELVEQEMPGFFDITEHPVNRLIVQFTDWELFGRMGCVPMIDKALASGVNMLSVVPSSYNHGAGSDLPAILRACKVQRGTTSLMRYNPAKPEQVWAHAAETLAR
jgi:hypothetical protein